jgi:WD40 repeat protein
VGAFDRLVMLWNVNTGETLNTFRGHKSGIQSVSYSPDGRRLGICDASEIQIWDVATQSKSEEPLLHGPWIAIGSLLFSPNGKLLAIYASSRRKEDVIGIQLLDATTGAEISIFKLDSLTDRTSPINLSILDFVFSSQSDKLVAINNDSTLTVFDTSSKNVIKKIRIGNFNRLKCAKLSVDAKRLVTSDGVTVSVWETATGRNLASFDSRTIEVESVAFSNSGKMAAAGCRDGKAILWDVARASEVNTLKGSAPVTYLVFSPDDLTVATGHGGDTACLWDAATGRKMFTWQGSPDEETIYGTFSPDGKRFAIGNFHARSLKIWDTISGLEVANLESGFTPSRLSFSPDGRCLAVRLDVSLVYLLHAASNEEVVVRENSK